MSRNSATPPVLLFLLLSCQVVVAREPGAPRVLISVSVTQPAIYPLLEFPRPSMMILDDRQIPLLVRVTNVTDGPLYIPRNLLRDYEYTAHDASGRGMTGGREPPMPRPLPPETAADWMRLERGASTVAPIYASAVDFDVRRAGAYTAQLLFGCAATGDITKPPSRADYTSVMSAPFSLTFGGSPAPSLLPSLVATGRLAQCFYYAGTANCRPWRG